MESSSGDIAPLQRPNPPAASTPDPPQPTMTGIFAPHTPFATLRKAEAKVAYRAAGERKRQRAQSEPQKMGTKTHRHGRLSA